MAALYLLERMFHVMTDGKLLNPLIAALMGGGCGGGGRGGTLVSLSEDEPVSPPGGVQMWDPKQVTSSKPRLILVCSESTPPCGLLHSQQCSLLVHLWDCKDMTSGYRSPDADMSRILIGVSLLRTFVSAQCATRQLGPCRQPIGPMLHPATN